MSLVQMFPPKVLDFTYQCVEMCCHLRTTYIGIGNADDSALMTYLSVCLSVCLSLLPSPSLG